MLRAAALSTHPEANEVASEVLKDGGTALGAALSGFFVAAGNEPGVLFAPLTVLVAEGGGGARVFDGRCRQPGVGAKRPRGFLPNETIPEAAYAAVPGSVAAAAVACAYGPGTSFGAVVRRGITAARKAGASRRAALLDRVAGLGAAVLGDPLLKGTLLGELGPAQGGLFSSGDLAPPRQLDWPAEEQGDLWIPPWARAFVEAASSQGEGNPGESSSAEACPKEVGPAEVGPEEVGRAAAPEDPSPTRHHVICAVDVRGRFVAVAFESCQQGIELPDVELVLPRIAVPVRRGVPRVEPGSALPGRAPLAIRRSSAGLAIEVLASPRSGTFEDPDIVIHRDPTTLEVSIVRR